jgi:hypothetical protein
MTEVADKAEHIEAWRCAARGERVDWEALFQGYQAAVDWPTASFWRKLLVVFPDAKVLLSLRDPETWYESVMNTIWPLTKALAGSADSTVQQQFTRMSYEVVWDAVFDQRMDDKDHVIGVFEAHNQAVIDTVSEEKLLIYRPSEGWEPLCEFLACPVPDEPYPKLNTTEQFQAHMQDRRSGG